MSEEAVTPIMAATIMLGIVVVLAAVAFAFARDVGTAEESTPALSFQKSESGDSIRIPRATPGTDWSAFQIRSDTAVPGLVMDINDPAGVGDTAVGTSFVQIGTGTISGGDRLYFCATSQTQDVRVFIIHAVNNENVYDTTFRTIKAC